MSDENQQEKIYGMMAALQAAIRALMKSHPNPSVLFQEIQKENEETIALLTGQPISDSAIQA